MGLFDFLTPPRKTDPFFGELVYRRNAWNGEVQIPKLHAASFQLEIRTARDSAISTFSETIGTLRTHIDDIKAQIAAEAYEIYEFYVAEDRRLGNFTDADYMEYPSVTSVSDVWNVLQPFRLTLTDECSDYNAMLWINVAWPNPHYFIACLQGHELYVLEVDG